MALRVSLVAVTVASLDKWIETVVRASLAWVSIQLYLRK